MRRIIRPTRLLLSFVFPLALLAYFLPLALPGLWARFALDDMMNMALYWNKGWSALLTAQVQFFSSYYRPFAGLFYMPILEYAGLNPFPYRVVLLCVLTANCLLAYDVARMVTLSRLIALLAAVFTSFHAAQFALFFNTSQLYDVWCFFFWFAAFDLYLRARQQGRVIRGWRLGGILFLYICALNSKEMAVTFPVALLLYEWMDLRTSGSMRRHGLLLSASALVTLFFVIGKMTGPNAMSSWRAYRPVFTVGRFLKANSHYAAELFYVNQPDIGDTGIVILWLFLAYLAARLRRRYLWWALGLSIIGTVPIAFIPDRGGACLYIPAFGYALFVAVLLTTIGKWLSREPLFRWLRCPPSSIRVVAAGLFVWWYGAWMHKIEQAILDPWARGQDLTWAMIREMEIQKRSIPKGAKILFLDEPFTDWDMAFITQLVLRDRASQVTLAGKIGRPLTEIEMAAFNCVFRADREHIVRVR